MTDFFAPPTSGGVFFDTGEGDPMFDAFGWIKRKAAEAVVQGVADGMRAVAPEGESPPADLDELRALLAAAVAPKQLAAAPDDEPAKAGGRRK